MINLQSTLTEQKFILSEDLEHILKWNNNLSTFF